MESAEFLTFVLCMLTMTRKLSAVFVNLDTESSMESAQVTNTVESMDTSNTDNATVTMATTGF